jgi:hypothetical protein
MRPHALAAFAALALTAGCSTNPMQPGLWEMRLTTRLDGLEQKVPVARECVTQKDIDDPQRTLPRPGGACKVANVDRRFGGKATYDIECRQDGRVMQGRAEIAFGAQAYEGRATLEVTEKGEKAPPLSIAVAARRVGACP